MEKKTMSFQVTNSHLDFEQKVLDAAGEGCRERKKTIACPHVDLQKENAILVVSYRPYITTS